MKRNSMSRPPRAQQGMALIVVLLLLLVVTLLGLAAMRGTLMQERMVGNAVARAAAFQVSESVLRQAEGFAAGRPGFPTSGCASGVCARPAVGADPAWQTAGFWDNSGGYRLADEVNGIRAKYVVEDFGRGESSSCNNSVDMSAPECTVETQLYRITVRSKAANGAEVILQSLYEVP